MKTVGHAYAYTHMRTHAQALRVHTSCMRTHTLTHDDEYEDLC